MLKQNWNKKYCDAINMCFIVTLTPSYIILLISNIKVMCTDEESTAVVTQWTVSSK